MTKFGKDPRPLAGILSEAADLALADAQLREIEALYIGAMNPEEFTGEANLASQVADELGLTGVPATRVETRHPRARPRSWPASRPSRQATISEFWCWQVRK
jgi:hypothetical protein